MTPNPGSGKDVRSAGGARRHGVGVRRVAVARSLQWRGAIRVLVDHNGALSAFNCCELHQMKVPAPLDDWMIDVPSQSICAGVAL
jgi:hypothetical protein